MTAAKLSASCTAPWLSAPSPIATRLTAPPPSRGRPAPPRSAIGTPAPTIEFSPRKPCAGADRYADPPRPPHSGDCRPISSAKRSASGHARARSPTRARGRSRQCVAGVERAACRRRDRLLAAAEVHRARRSRARPSLERAFLEPPDQAHQAVPVQHVVDRSGNGRLLGSQGGGRRRSTRRAGGQDCAGRRPRPPPPRSRRPAAARTGRRSSGRRAWAAPRDGSRRRREPHRLVERIQVGLERPVAGQLRARDPHVVRRHERDVRQPRRHLRLHPRAAARPARRRAPAASASNAASSAGIEACCQFSDGDVRASP